MYETKKMNEYQTSSIMKWENIIQGDRILSVSSDFTNRVVTRLSQEFCFKKRHISIGIVVGILIGFMMLGLQNRLETSKNRHSILKEWTRRYHLDDISLEKIEINLF